jgi:malonyl-CoA/methylmalonyl-CoA synthetase
MNENLYALFESRFPQDRAQPLLYLDGGKTLTYGDAQSRVARFAAFLTGLGLVPGDRVAVQVEKSPEALLLYLACLRAGFVYLPLNSAYQEGEIGYFLGNAEPRAVVAQPKSMSWLKPLAQRLGIRHVFSLDDRGHGTLVDGARDAPEKFETVARARDDLAAILYTSGTTGRSKGAMLTHGNLASNAVVLHKAWGFKPDDVLIHMLPLFHVHGLFVASHCVLANGSAMRFHAKFDARRGPPPSSWACRLSIRGCSRSPASTATRARTCGSSFPGRRRCSRRRTWNSRSARGIASWSATA